jgi:hypothetical protein
MSTLEELKARFDSLSRDLARMGRSKRGSQWHIDRVAERSRIGQQIDRLENVPDAPSYGRDFSAN